jgi:uncharacterized protein Yka (UPF0111/DUF47 family)
MSLHNQLATRVAQALRSYASNDAVCIWTVDEINEVTTVADDIGRLAASALGPELEELKALREASTRLARAVDDVADLIQAAQAVLDLSECFEESYGEFDDLAAAVARADRPLGW